MALGIVVIAVGTGAFLAGLAGLRGGRAVPLWSAVLAVAGAVVAIGTLLVQRDPDTASWLIAPMAGAVLSVVHGRTLFAQGGPFRT
jgi:hypothetical protein